MDVTRDNFARLLPRIQAAVDSCDFIAVDTELSGLWTDRDGRPAKEDSLQVIYEKLCRSSEAYVIVQFGLCCFQWNEDRSALVAQPFNFYVFPSTTTKHQVDRTFSCQASALDFLAKCSFDFNRWIYTGIPYLTTKEEAAYRAKRMSELDKSGDINIDQRGQDFLVGVRKIIDEWLSNGPEEDGCNIPCKNNFERMLVYNEIRKGDVGLNADGRYGFIRITRVTSEKKEENDREHRAAIESQIATAAGFRLVIDCLSKCGKLIVGHNMFLDLCQTYSQFCGTLPSDVNDFKKEITRLFPNTLDTKYLFAESSKQHAFTEKTSLAEVTTVVNREPFASWPKVELDWDFQRYHGDNGSTHEAGYDAYLTGIVYARLAAFLAKKKNDISFSADLSSLVTQDLGISEAYVMPSPEKRVRRKSSGSKSSGSKSSGSKSSESTTPASRIAARTPTGNDPGFASGNYYGCLLDDEPEYRPEDEDAWSSEEDYDDDDEQPRYDEILKTPNPIPSLGHNTSAIEKFVHWAYFAQTAICLTDNRTRDE